MSESKLKTCPCCGTENPAEANFCRKCRYDFRVAAGGPVEPAAAPSPGTSDPRKARKGKGGCLVVLLVCVAALFIWKKPDFFHRSEPVDNVVENFQPESYAGVYNMKLTSGSDVSQYVVVVESFAIDRYRMEVVTDYGKQIYTFSVMEDGSVMSPELGKAKVTYKKSIDKLSLEFTGVNVTCVLTK